MKRWLRRLRSIHVYYGYEFDGEEFDEGWFWYDEGEGLPPWVYSNRVHAWFDAILNRR